MPPKKPTKPKKTEEPICGIYAIKNIIDNKYYVGSSTNVKHRIQTHKRELLKGSHDVRPMQMDFNKHGQENFEFIILDKEIPEEMLTAYEKCYCYKFDSFVAYKGYNQNSPTTNHKLFKEAYNNLLKKGVF